MKVLFRADASAQRGTGHVMRCLTLAEELRQRGAEVFFICRELPGHLCGYLESKGFPPLRLPTYGAGEPWPAVDWQQDAEEVRQILKREFARGLDWLIVDHYALDRRWEEQMRPFVEKIMVIDDLADRPHDCDLLLDQNLYEDMENRYEGLVPGGCIKLLGPRYALLRPEFRRARENLRLRGGTIKRILVFFGGSDPTNETVKALEAIQMLERPDVAVDVVVGLSNPHKGQVERLCASMPNVNYYCQVENMAELMVEADLAIGAGGSVTWERCYLGLPSIVLIIADNQRSLTLAVAAQKAIINLGYCYNAKKEDIANFIAKLLGDKVMVLDMSKAALSIMVDNDLGHGNVVELMGMSYEKS